MRYFITSGRVSWKKKRKKRTRKVPLSYTILLRPDAEPNQRKKNREPINTGDGGYIGYKTSFSLPRRGVCSARSSRNETFRLNIHHRLWVPGVRERERGEVKNKRGGPTISPSSELGPDHGDNEDHEDGDDGDGDDPIRSHPGGFKVSTSTHTYTHVHPTSAHTTRKGERGRRYLRAMPRRVLTLRST